MTAQPNASAKRTHTPNTRTDIRTRTRQTMFPVVKVCLSILRAASHGALFAEAQRLALRFIRPSSEAILHNTEMSMLDSAVLSPRKHILVPAPTLPLHTICVGEDACEAATSFVELCSEADVTRRCTPFDLACDPTDTDRTHHTCPTRDQQTCSIESEQSSQHQHGRTHHKTPSSSPHPTDKQQQHDHDHNTHPSVPSNRESDERPAIVLLHGHSMSASFYFRNLDDFVSLGYRVFAIDLLGWGRSARPRFRGTTIEHTIEWYMESLSGWVSSMPLPSRFVLLGHSLGAYLALEFTKRYPQRIDRLVLISPAAIAKSIPIKRAVYFSLPPQSIVRRGGVLGLLFYLSKYPRQACYLRDHLCEYTWHLAAQQPPSGEIAVKPIIKFDSFTQATCTRPLIDTLQDSPLSFPVQIVCGETDASINIEDVHMLYREMKRRAYDVRIKVVEGTDHCPHFEAPEEFFHAVADFLALARYKTSLP